MEVNKSAHQTYICILVDLPLKKCPYICRVSSFMRQPFLEILVLSSAKISIPKFGESRLRIKFPEEENMLSPESSNLYKSYVFSKLVVFKINVSKNKNFLKHLRKHNNMLLKIHLGSLCFHDLCDKERNK